MAHRLARWSGILDVEAWRDGVSPEVFDRWVAFDAIEGDPWNRLAEILKLGFTSLATTWGAEVTPDYFEPSKEKAKPHVAGPAEAAALVRTACIGH